MRYMLLTYENEVDRDARSGAEEAAIAQEHLQVIDSLKATDRYVTSDRLDTTATATTVRVRSGGTLVADGPFARTSEQLLGYYLVDARNLDDAIAIAARIHAARNGCVEIRPVLQGHTVALATGSARGTEGGEPQ